MQQHPPSGLMSINTFCAWASLGRTKVYEEIASGKLRTFQVGRRRLVAYEDAHRWLEGHAARPASQKQG